MSKKYTITYFINEIQTKTKGSHGSLGVVNAISPTYGLDSVKIETLNSLIGDFNAVVNGFGKYAGFGKTPRTRLLKALKLRKKFGFAA